MKSIINVIRAEFLKYTVELRRYWFETVSVFAIYIIVFTALFAGVKVFSGSEPNTDTLDSLIIGYLTWVLSMRAFQSIALSISEEMQRGTLEQLYLSPYSVRFIMLLRAFYDFLFTLVSCVLVLLILMTITGRWLNFNPGQVILIVCISIPSIWGFGLILGSLVLVFKKIVSFSVIISFALISVSVINAPPLSTMSFLPFITGTTLIRRLVVFHGSADFFWYIFIFAISIVYLLLGLVLFINIEKVARKKNLLGVY
ncbi:MAG: hypothetical protein JW874_00450 [Spirochaetales bacterium]|nr:hypothetical protein [Spirochaetales bacterium]